jgi:hypothetical protein
MGGGRGHKVSEGEGPTTSNGGSSEARGGESKAKRSERGFNNSNDRVTPLVRAMS